MGVVSIVVHGACLMATWTGYTFTSMDPFPWALGARAATVSMGRHHLRSMSETGVKSKHQY